VFALVVVLGLALAAMVGPVAAAPDGQMTWAVHVSLAPTWFDPAETPALLTPFMVLYALHDALVKPMPGNVLTPSLAESWSASKDGLAYDFVLRKGAKFHTGDPVTAEDVKFSFERYKGAAAKTLKERVAGVDVLDASRVRFRMKSPWPDFMTFFGTPATGAAWIVPKKYVEKVGEDGFKKAPVGAGPYKFVSFNPGVELVMEAFEPYWRKSPSVKRLVFKVVPDETTRLAMLKRGEADIAYSVRGPLADEIKRTPGLTLKPTAGPFTEWILFADQFDPKSPWHDRRVRLAANLAVDRDQLNQAESIGASRTTGSIVPSGFDFALAIPPYPFDPVKARQLLAEAGYPRGFEAGDLWCDISTTGTAEAVLNALQGAGIRARLRPVERAAFLKQYQEKKLKNLVYGLSGIGGNAATRIEVFTASSGAFAYGAYPDIDALFRDQAGVLDPKKREALLHRIQQLMHEKVMYLPIWQLALLQGYGPRVAESGLGLIADYPWAAPYEDVKLKAK
jgi:peptide/nickel transport system substrate-binding protein